MQSFLLSTPIEFKFDHSIAFLRRSKHEILHQCTDDGVTKLIMLKTKQALVKVQLHDQNNLKISNLNGKLNEQEKSQAARYIIEWLDLKTDLKPFYKIASKDKLLASLVDQYFGYRVVGMPDLFESLVWAVTGQQINLNFAYLLKQRLIMHFGTHQTHDGIKFYAFPTPDVLAGLAIEDLLPMQFSKQKANYIIGIAQAFNRGELSKELLSSMDFQQAKEELIRIKGVGNWTANYVLMKTFHHPEAFPIEDAGLHNALKNQLKLDRKPSLEEIRTIFKKYKGWESYALLYLWKSL